MKADSRASFRPTLRCSDEARRELQSLSWETVDVATNWRRKEEEEEEEEGGGREEDGELVILHLSSYWGPLEDEGRILASPMQCWNLKG